MLVNKKIDSLIAEVKTEIKNQKARLSDLQQLLANLQKFGSTPEEKESREEDVEGKERKKPKRKVKVPNIRPDSFANFILTVMRNRPTQEYTFSVLSKAVKKYSRIPKEFRKVNTLKIGRALSRLHRCGFILRISKGVYKVDQEVIHKMDIPPFVPKSTPKKAKTNLPSITGKRRGRPLKDKKLRQNLMKMLREVSPKSVSKDSAVEWLKWHKIMVTSTKCETYLADLFRSGFIQKVKSGQYHGRYYYKKSDEEKTEHNSSSPVTEVISRKGITFVKPSEKESVTISPPLPVKKKKAASTSPLPPTKKKKATPAVAVVPDAPSSSSSITNRVKAALKHYASKDEFEISQVMSFIEQKFSTQYSGAQVAGALRRLCSKGKIKRVRIGVYTAKI